MANIQMILFDFIKFLNQNDGNLKNKLIRSGIWVTIANTFVRILEFARSIILAHLLTPEIFGIWGIVNFVRQGIEVFTQTGFGAELIHRQKRLKEAADVAWTLNVIRGFVLTLLCFFAAPYVAAFYDRPILSILLKIVGFSFLIKGFSNINVLLFQKELDFKKVVILQQSTALIGLVVTLSLAFAWKNVWALVWGTLAYFVADLVLSYVIQGKVPRIYFEKRLLKEIFRYGAFVGGAGIVVFLSTQADNAIVGKILGMKALGIYALAYTVANLPATEITQIVSKIMFPAYSTLQNDTERLKSLYLKALKLISLLAIPAAVGLWVLAPEIIRVIYGQKWLQAVIPLRVLCIYGAVRSIAATAGPIYNAIGMPKIPFLLNTGRLVMMIALIYPLTKSQGVIGTSYCVTFSIIITAIVSWKIISNLIGVTFLEIVAAIAFPVLGAGVMLLSLVITKRLILMALSLSTLLSLVVIGIAVYVSLFAIFQRSYLKEILKLAKA